MDPIANFQGCRTAYSVCKALTLAEQKKAFILKDGRLQTSANFRLQLQFESHLVYLWSVLRALKTSRTVATSSSLPLWTVHLTGSHFIWWYTRTQTPSHALSMLKSKIPSPWTHRSLCAAAVWSTAWGTADGFILYRRCLDGVPE